MVVWTVEYIPNPQEPLQTMFCGVYETEHKALAYCMMTMGTKEPLKSINYRNGDLWLETTEEKCNFYIGRSEVQ